MSNKRPLIGVVINTYNAERHLEQVLESVAGFDDILVCDMESDDNTCEIARRRGARVITYPRGENNICEAARDYAIHSTECDWVLVVDADEIVTPQLHDYLYSRVRKNPDFAALLVPRINKFMGQDATGTPDYQLRFMRPSAAAWPPVIHAKPEINGKVEKIPARRRDLYLRHLDDPSVHDRLQKIDRYTDNEIPKRRARRFSALSMLFRPVWFFIRDYFVGGGWRDGRRGILKAYMTMVYQIALMAKVTESQTLKNDKPEAAEQ